MYYYDHDIIIIRYYNYSGEISPLRLSGSLLNPLRLSNANELYMQSSVDTIGNTGTYVLIMKKHVIYMYLYIYIYLMNFRLKKFVKE